MSSAKSASHPVSASSSQSPKPSPHEMAQPRPVHDASPLRSLQTLPQTTQSSSELRFASQRSLSSWLQSAEPAGHSVDVQIPPLQKSDAHTAPQRPQFWESEARSVSQPLSESWSQSSRPVSQLEEPAPPPPPSSGTNRYSSTPQAAAAEAASRPASARAGRWGDPGT